MIWINISITRVTMSYSIVRYFFNRRRLQTVLSTFNSGGKVSYRLFNFFPSQFSNDTIISVCNSYVLFPLDFSVTKITFSLPVVSFLLLRYGYITAKYRSNAMTTREKEEAVAPVHIRFPPVKNLQSSVPAKPSGCLNVWIRINCGAINSATIMSATARLTSKKFIGVLPAKIEKC